MQLKSHKIAGVLATITLGLVALGLFRGRWFQRNYAFAIEYIPYAAILIAVILTVFIFLVFKSSNEHITSGWRALFVFSVITGFFLVIAAILTMTVTELNIEQMHIIKYFLLALFIFFCPRKKVRLLRFILAFTVSSVVGTCEETIQLWVPDRIFDWRDIVLNVTSALVGALYAVSLSTANRWLIKTT